MEMSFQSPMMSAPASPFGICTWPLWCEWYMPTAVSRAVNSYENDSPGLIAGCVYGSTPSIAFGTRTPWRCSEVDSVSSFFRLIRTLSPTFARMTGPGICPL
jgi:hypothetical protein